MLVGAASCPLASECQTHAPEASHSRTSFASSGEEIVLERYRSAPTGPTVIFLCGSGGCESPNVPYRRFAIRIARSGYQVYILNYLTQAVNAETTRPPYRRYVEIVRDAIRTIKVRSSSSHDEGIALIGYSLGASVALAEASGNVSIAAVVSWNGSLPDEYVLSSSLPATLVIQGEDDKVIPEWNAEQLMALCRVKKFNCRLKLYPNEGHKFTSASVADVEEEILQFVGQYLPTGRPQGTNK